MAKKEASQSVRDEFSKLSLDGKTSFLVEAVFSTAGSAIHEIGERVTSLVDLVAGAVSSDESDESSNTADEADSSSSDEEEDSDTASK